MSWGIRDGDREKRNIGLTYFTIWEAMDGIGTRLMWELISNMSSF